MDFSTAPPSTNPFSSSGLQQTSMIPQDVLREARAKWALEDAKEEAQESVGENDRGRGANVVMRAPDSPSKHRSQRFMRFIDAWRKTHDNGQAQNAIRAANLVLEWARMIVKVRVLLQAVYKDSRDVGKVVAEGEGGGEGIDDPLIMLRKFDSAVSEEHEAAVAFSEVSEIAKNIDAAEAEAEGKASRYRMRIRCMDVVSVEEWRKWRQGEGGRGAWGEVVRVLCGGGEGEEELRTLQQIDLHEFAAAGHLEQQEMLKKLKELERGLEGDGETAGCVKFLVRSLINSHDSPAIKFAQELDWSEAGEQSNALVPCVRQIARPRWAGGGGGLGLLQAMIAGGEWGVLAADRVTGVSAVEAAAVDGNSEALLLLVGGLGGEGLRGGGEGSSFLGRCSRRLPSGRRSRGT